jgi:hypothetical protein
MDCRRVTEQCPKGTFSPQLDRCFHGRAKALPTICLLSMMDSQICGGTYQELEPRSHLKPVRTRAEFVVHELQDHVR